MKEGWEIKQLGDVCDIYQPTTIAKKEMIPDGNYNVFGANGIIGKYDKFNHKESELLITCRGATCGSVNISLPYSWINGNAMVVRPKTEHLKRNYLEYLFRGGIEISKIITGAAQPQITRQSLSPILIPIPPPDEQKRIVAKLDKVFEAIDKARTNVGKNLQNAKELFQSKNNDIFQQIENTVDSISLPSVCDEIFAGGDAPKNNYSKEKTDKYNIPIFANAVKSNGLYGYTNIIRASKPSITIAARGSGTGHTEIRYEPFYPIVRLIVITPNIDIVNLEFLKYSIQNFEIIRSGSAIPQLTVPMIKGYSLLLPKLNEQKLIVNKLDELKSQTQALEYNYQQELEALDELKKSILQKAFEGEL
ncbi:MAG: restriction endonuclease subunit S [Planctomycetia bacterium]|nr:restriction endonuclease subunit S [Planctomycetia bacterium]